MTGPLIPTVKDLEKNRPKEIKELLSQEKENYFLMRGHRKEELTRRAMLSWELFLREVLR